MYKGKNIMRQILEMPTTDPGGDFFQQCLTTEDEDSDLEECDGCPKSHRRADTYKGKNTDCVKRMMTPIVYDTMKLMPPELIIKSAKTDESYSSGGETKERQTIGPTQNLTEFPPINTNRRTKTWHNFNRYVSTIKGNINQEIINYETSDNLQMKLSLKKKLWTGTCADFNLSRPLSWGIPPLIKMPIYDSHALLEACSQKLAVWQESENRIGELKNKTVTTIVKNLSRSADNSKHKKHVKPKTETKDIPEFHEHPVKEKKKPRVYLNKIVETTDLISRLAKGTKLVSSKKITNQPSSTNQTKTNKGPNKFKTGGIVATIVQPSKKFKKIRHPPQQIHKKLDSCTETDSENIKIFVKKVKTKMKKKKTKNN